jgi:hypothetical protein
MDRCLNLKRWLACVNLAMLVASSAAQADTTLSAEPAGAFWSLTMYDNQGFQVLNPINRFAIGDRDKLKFNEDGSLDIYVQAQSPGKDKCRCEVATVGATPERYRRR